MEKNQLNGKMSSFDSEDEDSPSIGFSGTFQEVKIDNTIKLFLFKNCLNFDYSFKFISYDRS